MATQQTAKTEYISAKGVKYGYRRFGAAKGTPLLFLQHFRATMDHWDPAVINPLAESHPIILFDNAGVGHSSGEVADTVRGMADHVVTFITALQVAPVDILGFSIGGYVAQMTALNAPHIVRKVILVGTAPSAGSQIQGLSEEVAGIATANLSDASFLKLFFAPSETSQAAGRAFWKRINERKGDVEDPRKDFISGDKMMRQVTALVHWGNENPENPDPKDYSFDRLEQIKARVLVVQGHTDIMVPTIGSFIMQQRIPYAQLIVYPDSSHASFYQFSEQFVQDANIFLDA